MPVVQSEPRAKLLHVSPHSMDGLAGFGPPVIVLPEHNNNIPVLGSSPVWSKWPRTGYSTVPENQLVTGKVNSHELTTCSFSVQFSQGPSRVARDNYPKFISKLWLEGRTSTYKECMLLPSCMSFPFLYAPFSSLRFRPPLFRTHRRSGTMRAAARNPRLHLFISSLRLSPFPFLLPLLFASFFLTPFPLLSFLIVLLFNKASMG